MLVVAVGGLAVNAASAAILHPVHGHSLNARGAYLHVVGDLLGSVGTVAAAIIVRGTGWLAADPIASIAVTLLVMRSAWRLVRESVDVLLEATPAHISLGRVREGLQAIGGIESVHDLHVWTVTSGMVAMSAHAVVREPAENQKVLEAAVAAMQRLGHLARNAAVRARPDLRDALSLERLNASVSVGPFLATAAQWQASRGVFRCCAASPASSSGWESIARRCE